MDRDTQNRWRNEVLDEVFEALAKNRTLVGSLVFKGARILADRLADNGRRSYDLDANLAAGFVAKYPTKELQIKALETEVRAALDSHFRSQDPLRFQVQGVRAALKPGGRGHPLGWDAIEIVMMVADSRVAATLGLPRIKLDIAAPEQLSAGATSGLSVGGGFVTAYSVERLVAEKMRAFLQSLPGYREKLHRPGYDVRAKDLYDIKRVLEAHPLDDEEFWRRASSEFRDACESRAVDCSGFGSFQEELQVTRDSFENDQTIPKTWTFSEVFEAIEAICNRFESQGVFPLKFALPEGGGVEAPE